MSSAFSSMFERNWAFRSSSRSLLLRMSRIKSLATGRRRAPASIAIRAITARSRWNGVFIYLPHSELSAAQRFSISKVAALSGSMVVVCAAPTPADVPAELLDGADAVYWKALSGFDFSAYALILREVADHSAGADLYLQNDSVLGPFGDVDQLLADAPWRMTGFMASAALENHIQSYAFMLRKVDAEMVEALSAVLSARWAYDDWRDVVNLQETRLARIAAKSMTVGAMWFAPRAGGNEIGLRTAVARKLGVKRSATIGDGVLDPSLVAARALTEQGFPFVKKSLFERNRKFQDTAALEHFLRQQGHPSMMNRPDEMGGAAAQAKDDKTESV